MAIGFILAYLSVIDLFNKLPLPLEVDREHRIEKKQIIPKLQKAWALAQKQKMDERDGPTFQSKSYRFFQAPPSCHSESLQVGKYSVGICHAKGRRPSQEDQHVAMSFSLHLPGGSVYPIELFGVFDGHGGPEASLYVSKHLPLELEKTLKDFHPKGKLTDEGIWNALKLTFVRLSDRFKKIDVHP